MSQGWNKITNLIFTMPEGVGKKVNYTYNNEIPAIL